MKTGQGVVIIASLVVLLAGCVGFAGDDPAASRDCGPEDPLRSPDDVTTHRRGDEWVAEATYTATGPPGEAIGVEVVTTNGGIDLDAQGSQASIEVTARARADTRTEAIERARGLEVTAHVDGRVVACAVAPAGDWDGRGADVDLSVPAPLSGRLDTSNGAIHLDDVEAGRLAARTVNGPIEGSLSAATQLEAGTVNAPVNLDVVPTDELSVRLETVNAPITLGLAEDPVGVTDHDNAFDIDASTANGRITESMTTAHLEGSDTDATLVSDRPEGRSRTVTGRVGTVNADIHFRGLVPPPTPR